MDEELEEELAEAKLVEVLEAGSVEVMEEVLAEVLEAGSVEVMEEVLVEVTEVGLVEELAEQSVREAFHHQTQTPVESGRIRCLLAMD
jgi:hypothetical protein